MKFSKRIYENLLITIVIVSVFTLLNKNLFITYYEYLKTILFAVHAEGNYFPAGDDIHLHIRYVSEVYADPAKVFISPYHLYEYYPSIFHLLIALYVIITKISIENAFAFYGAFLMILAPILYAFVYVRLIPYKSYHLLTVSYLGFILIFVAFSSRILQSLNDANYPELTVSLLLIPLLILLIENYFKSHRPLYFYLIPTLVAITLNINFLGGIYALILYIVFLVVNLFVSNNPIRKLLESFKSIILLIVLWIILGPYRFLKFLSFTQEFSITKSVVPSSLVQKISLEEISYFMFFDNNVYTYFLVIILLLTIYVLLQIIEHKKKWNFYVVIILNFFTLLIFALILVFNYLRIARYEAVILPLTLSLNVIIVTISILLDNKNSRIFRLFVLFLVFIFFEVVAYIYTNLKPNIYDVFLVSHRIDDNKYKIYNYLLSHYTNFTYLVIHPLDIWLYVLHNSTLILWPYPYVLNWFGQDDPRVILYKNLTELLLQGNFRELNTRYDIGLIVISLPYESQWYHDFVAPFLYSLRNLTEKAPISRVRIFLYAQLEPGDALISNIKVIDERFVLNISKVFWIIHMKKYKDVSENVVYVLGFPKNTVLSFRKAEPYSIGERLYNYVVESNYTQTHIKPGTYYVETEIALNNKYNNYAIELLVFIFPNSYNGEPLFTYVFVLRPELYSGFS